MAAFDAGKSESAGGKGMADHPWRRALTEELHARPYGALTAPVRASHLAMVSGEETAAHDRAHVAALCERYGAAAPGADAWHISVDLGRFRLKWERHAEFSTYTFFEPGPFADPFADPPIGRVPADWLGQLGGERLVAVHVALEPATAPPRPLEELYRLFDTDNVAASLLLANAAEAFSDFHLREDGFGRILVRDRTLRPLQAGRLVQRLLEIETYRMMALLALPHAREVAPQVTAIDRALAEIATTMGRLENFDDEKSLLTRLTELSTGVERISASTSYRFGAARAYYALVVRRIEELRESRIEGLQTFEEFMDRRLAPAMRTCESASARLDKAAERVSRAASLLTTRVDLELEGQNQQLLQSMNRRARLQLRLQQAVEGLSITAISYYLMGLVGYVAKAVEHLGVPIDPDIVQGISIVPIVVLVGLGVRQVRRTIEKADAAGR
ncbi:MAG TPA: DUF3422 domain-containing protein [Alphaproteobacteria bacterium]|nr:DUF3422 domain-containing protein [Alphaproteobacteria bacterium]